MTKKRTNSRVLSEVHEAARDLRKAGAMDETTMRRFDELCLLSVSRLAAAGRSGKRTGQDSARR